MDKVMYTLFEFVYLVLFSTLGIMTFTLHIPKEKGMQSYRKARQSLGFALSSIVTFCLIRILVPQSNTHFVAFWMMVIFTIMHSWFTYTAMLFLLETPKFITRYFFIDGLAPIVMILICGTIGLVFPTTSGSMEIVFGIIFALKVSYMFCRCIKEYYNCEHELNNYYDVNPDIKWIKRLIFLSLFMSVITIVAFYVTFVEIIYLISVPIIYIIIVVKVFNFAPRKIDAVRKKNAEMEKLVPAKKKSLELDEKIGPKVEVWVNAKKYCIPELTIKDVAQEIGTNHNYLSMYINNYLDTSFQVWLNTLRIEESKKLLTDGTKRSIEEVGTLVGFSQLYNFSRWFRNVTGTTPFQYRKNN